MALLYVRQILGALCGLIVIVVQYESSSFDSPHQGKVGDFSPVILHSAESQIVEDSFAEFVHVTTVPGRSMMTPHRILESTVSIWSMVQAKRRAEADGDKAVHLLLLVEGDDWNSSATHPILEQIEPWLDDLHIAPVQQRFAVDLMPVKNESRAQQLGNRTVTTLRDALAAAYSIFPNVDAYVYTNPDIAMFRDTYKWMMERKLTPATILRTDVFCDADDEHCPKIVKHTQQKNVSSLTEQEMKWLMQSAKSFDQEHPGHDTFIIPKNILPCMLKVMPLTFLGFPPVGETMVDAMRACACSLNKRSYVQRYGGESRTFHLGNGRAADKAWGSKKVSHLLDFNVDIGSNLEKKSWNFDWSYHRLGCFASGPIIAIPVKLDKILFNPRARGSRGRGRAGRQRPKAAAAIDEFVA